jgi:pyruvate formate lyase activating enzyme
VVDAIGEKAPALEAANEFELRVGLSRHVPEMNIRTGLATGEIGFLHSFTTGSAVDGPGIRLVAWLAGCMFRCRFCHNPDTWAMTNGLPVPFDRAVEELRNYAHGLKVMGGGLTLSGGEPLMQARFVARLFAAAKAMRVHTAIETNGFYSERLSDDELSNIDLVILDMKGFTAGQHERVTGVADNARILTFGERLARMKRPMWLRFVLVPGLTDVPDEMARLADYAAGLGVVERVEVLPFHQMGAFKWARLGLGYTLEATQPPSAEQTEAAITVFRNAGLNAC